MKDTISVQMAKSTPENAKTRFQRLWDANPTRHHDITEYWLYTERYSKFVLHNLKRGQRVTPPQKAALIRMQKALKLTPPPVIVNNLNPIIND